MKQPQKVTNTNQYPKPYAFI